MIKNLPGHAARLTFYTSGELRFEFPPDNINISNNFDYINMNTKKITFIISTILAVLMLTGFNALIINILSNIPNMTLTKLSLILAIFYVLPSAICLSKRL